MNAPLDLHEAALSAPLGLTRRMYECLCVIVEFFDEYGYPPTFDELRVELDAKSKATPFRLVQALCRRGWITYVPGHARSITVLRRPVMPDFETPLLELTEMGKSAVAGLLSALA